MSRIYDDTRLIFILLYNILHNAKKIEYIIKKILATKRCVLAYFFNICSRFLFYNSWENPYAFFLILQLFRLSTYLLFLFIGFIHLILKIIFEIMSRKPGETLKYLKLKTIFQ